MRAHTVAPLAVSDQRGREISRNGRGKSNRVARVARSGESYRGLVAGARLRIRPVRPRTYATMKRSEGLGGASGSKWGGGHQLCSEGDADAVSGGRAGRMESASGGLGMLIRLHTAPVLRTLDIALSNGVSGVIRHTDHGYQCASYAFGHRCRAGETWPS